MWWDKRQEYYYDPYGGNEDLHNDGCLSMFFWLVVSGLVCFFMGSCKTEYIPIETVKTEYHHTRDSIHHTDSIIKETQLTIMQLDSEAMAQYGIKLENAEKAWLVLQKELESKIKKLMEHKTDSFIKTDTIRVPYPVVTNKVRWQDKAAYIGLGIVISVFIIVVIFVVRWLLARRLI